MAGEPALKIEQHQPSRESLRAWLEGRGPCPWPGEPETESLRRGAELLLLTPSDELSELLSDNPTTMTTEQALELLGG